MALRFFRCNKCKKMFVMVHEHDCPTMCCGEPMKELIPGTTDAAQEKHVPVYEVSGDTVTVKVGSVAHPMTEEHHIEWIEVINGPYVNRKYLKPGEKPEADFYVPLQKGMVVREYCNIHGLWEYTVE